ncbi:MAG: CoA-binding protein [Candidatus Hermodarchaeota archaeon]|nr:CoA-binding protein [Candidatus Hermodarchaeota archaeon]
MPTKVKQEALAPLFAAQSVVLVGASGNPQSFGFQVARSLIRHFKGPIHYVSATEAKVLGDATFASISEVPKGNHLWIIATLTKDFDDTLRLIGQRNPLAILILIELLPEQEGEVRKAIATLSCPVIGPRSAGFFDSTSHLDMIPFPPEILARPQPGTAGVITDNRDVAFGLLEQLSKYHCGVSRLIDLGETYGIQETDVINFFANDDGTKVILLGTGQLSNLPAFQHAIKTVHNVNKPVIVSLFPEDITSQLGLHRRTGETITSLTTEIAKQNGLMITSSWGSAVDLTLLCQNQPLPQGPNVVAISNFGAYCVYAASALHTSELNLAKLSPETKSTLHDNLPPYCRCENPICLYTNTDEVRLDTALNLVFPDPNAHSLILSLLPDSPNLDPDYLYVMLRQRLKALNTPKTIIAVIPTRERDNLLVQSLERLHIPVYSNHHRAVRTLENAYHLAQLRIK